MDTPLRGLGTYPSTPGDVLSETRRSTPEASAAWTSGRPLDDALDATADAFERLCPRLFGIAYRVLGSVSEAEDVVQDVWVRRQGADRSAVLDHGAFPAKITTRLAINVARSARRSTGPFRCCRSRPVATCGPCARQEQLDSIAG